jgi:hypothetical protein
MSHPCGTVDVFFGMDMLIAVCGRKEREDCQGIEHETKI